MSAGPDWRTRRELRIFGLEGCELVWCLHCETVQRVDRLRWARDAQLGQFLLRCAFTDCDGTLIDLQCADGIGQVAGVVVPYERFGVGTHTGEA